MPTPLYLPVIAANFEAGTIGAWCKAVGDPIAVGDVLVQVETDKAVVDVLAEESGVLGSISIEAGTADVPVNAVLGFLLKGGETLADIPDGGTASLSNPVEPPSGVSEPTRRIASPLARRLASERGVDISALTGRGPKGRILKADIEAAFPRVEGPAPGAIAAGPALPATREAGRDIPNSAVRKVIARRLTAAKQDIPHFYLTVECEIDALLEVRRQLNEHYASAGVKISVNDCVVKAAALALADVPAANATWSDESIHQHGTVDVSVAVATPQGLMTPIVRDADKKSLVDLSRELKALAAKATAGKLQPAEFTGGGFSVSNLGMYGIKAFSAIINPPQSCILAVGAAERRPIVRGERIEIATVMTCTLSVDHRSVDGAVGAELLAAFRKYLRHPALMLLSVG